MFLLLIGFERIRFNGTQAYMLPAYTHCSLELLTSRNVFNVIWEI